MERFFVWVQRFNSTVIGVGLLFILGLLALGGVKEAMALLRAESKTVAAPQNAGGQGERGTIYSLQATEHSSRNGTVVFRLQSRGGRGGGVAYAEGRAAHTRNLLFFREGAGQSRWLFADQTRVLSRVEEYSSGAGEADVLLVEVESDREHEAQEGERHARDVYLVHMDGTGLQRILTGVEEMLNRKTVHGQLQIAYQSADAVRLARFSLQDFRQLADVEVARVETLGK